MDNKLEIDKNIIEKMVSCFWEIKSTGFIELFSTPFAWTQGISASSFASLGCLIPLVDHRASQQWFVDNGLVDVLTSWDMGWSTPPTSVRVCTQLTSVLMRLEAWHQIINENTGIDYKKKKQPKNKQKQTKKETRVPTPACPLFAERKVLCLHSSWTL